MTHPAPETLAEFIDGKLRGNTRAVVVEHIEDCDDCLMIVGETARLFEEEPVPTRRASWRTWPLMAAAMVTVAFFSAWMLRDRIMDPLAPLEKASRNLETRPVDGRLEGFDYRPARTMRGGGQKSTDPKVLLVESIAAQVRRTNASSTGNAKRQHAAGVAALIEGDRQSAQRLLRNAAELSPETSAYWSDYAVALAEAGQFDEALLAALTAVARNPPSDSARFNLALTYELMGRSNEAIAAYDEFLKSENESRWAQEAASRREQLRSRTR